MSRDIIPEMYRASFSTPFFWIDDVYVTGALTPKVKNIEYIDLVKNFTLKEAIAHDEYMKNGAVTHLFAHVKKPPNFMICGMLHWIDWLLKNWRLWEILSSKIIIS